MAYDVRKPRESIQQIVVKNLNPTNDIDNSGGGIWMSGAGIASDEDDNIYFSTGNGLFDPSVNSYSDSIVKMHLKFWGMVFLLVLKLRIILHPRTNRI